MPKARASKARPALEPLPYPPVDRDFAFVVDAAVPAARLLDAIKGVERRLIRECGCSTSMQAPASARARSRWPWRSACRRRDRTLTEAEIEAVAGKIVASAEKATGAVLR